MVCVWFSPAPFTPAVFLAFVLLPIAGTFGVSGSFVTAVSILGFSSLAIALSPIEILDGSLKWTLIAVSCYLIGFGGLIMGLRRRGIANDAT